MALGLVVDFSFASGSLACNLQMVITVGGNDNHRLSSNWSNIKGILIIYENEPGKINLTSLIN